ncbi:DUF1223 domain-containing protein [Paraburkholderia fungorum]|uniref:DUF1223 domain-containing protein n=1 Tax=Paraburkholderia fungorum TaxID=134537 RepID=UPI0038B9E2B9
MRVITILSLAAVLIVCLVGGASASATTSCSVSSPPHRVALVELYTSEGCRSCPPAENWLSALDQAGEANTSVPLALHVDYWDSPSSRQRVSRWGRSFSSAHRT